MTTTLTHEVWIVRREAGASAPPPPEWCPGCAGPSLMLTPDEAAAVAGVRPRVIREWAEAARLHSIEASDGVLLICLSSLPV